MKHNSSGGPIFPYSTDRHRKKWWWVMTVLMLAVPFVLRAQDTTASERASPPAMTRSPLPSGATLRIKYGQPSLRGRTIGVDVEPMKGKLWRAGANEATEVTIDKNVLVEGKPLPAGRYALFMLPGDKVWTIIFNKVYDQWGAFNYKPSEDALRVQVVPGKTPYRIERLTYLISRQGKLSMWWGDTAIDIQVQ